MNTQNNNDQSNIDFVLHPICVAESGQLVELQAIPVSEDVGELSYGYQRRCWFAHLEGTPCVEAEKNFTELVVCVFKDWLAESTLAGDEAPRIGLPLTMETGLSHFFLEWMLGLAQLYKIDPDQVVFHLHEPDCVWNEKALVLIRSLSRAGFGVAIDSFVSDGPNFEILSHPGIDYLSCDQRVPKSAADYELGWRFLVGLVALTEKLGKKVVLNSVDSGEELDAIRKLKGVYFQGKRAGGPLRITKLNKRAL